MTVYINTAGRRQVDPGDLSRGDRRRLARLVRRASRHTDHGPKTPQRAAQRDAEPEASS